MDLTLKGRGVRITEQFRTRAAHKLSKLDRLHADLQRLEIEVTSDGHAKTNGSKRLDATLDLRRHTLRASATAADLDAGLDLLVERLERQVRDYRAKRKKRLLPGGNRLKSARIGPRDRGPGA